MSDHSSSRPTLQNWPVRATVPIRSVARVALLAMEMRVNPRALGRMDILRNGVSAAPVAMAGEPESPHEGCESGRRLGLT